MSGASWGWGGAGRGVASPCEPMPQASHLLAGLRALQQVPALLPDVLGQVLAHLALDEGYVLLARVDLGRIPDLGLAADGHQQHAQEDQQQPRGHREMVLEDRRSAAAAQGQARCPVVAAAPAAVVFTLP